MKVPVGPQGEFARYRPEPEANDAPAWQSHSQVRPPMAWTVLVHHSHSETRLIEICFPKKAAHASRPDEQ